METTLLLVDDDDRLTAALSAALTELGFAVEAAGTGEAALASVARRRPDAVLLDLALPGTSGIEVCRRLRALGDLAVIMISGRDSSDDVVAALEAGADDYVVKPVDAAELAARVRAVLRRLCPPGTVLRLGPLELRPDEAVVLRRGEPVELTKTEFRLLCELAQEPGRVHTREELLQRVWGYDYFGDTRLLDVHVRRLRTKVEDDPGDPQLVLTERGVGYRLGA